MVGPFSVQSSITAGGASSIGATTDTLSVTFGSATFAVAVLQPLQGAAVLAAPATGSLRISATDASRLTASISGATVSLAVDTNGDGTVDGTLSVPWDFLH